MIEKVNKVKQSPVIGLLRDLCLQKIEKEILCTSSPSTNSVSFTNLTLQWMPIDLSQEVFDYCLGQSVAEEVNNVLHLFLKIPTKTPLQSISLQNCRRANVDLITDLVKANLKTLQHLDIRGCRTFPRRFWNLLNQAPCLLSFKTTKLLMPLRCPSLEKLVVDWKPRKVIQKLQARMQTMFFDKLLETVLPNLKFLDLSWCPWVKRLKCLKTGKNLEVLILRNCDFSCLLPQILQLTNLRALDISVGLESESNQVFSGEYLLPEEILEKIVSCLPNLESLDISGTNLVAACSKDDSIDNIVCALKQRYGKPFKFLGVYSTFYDVPPAKELPANVIAANTNDASVIEAIKRHYDMPKTLHVQLYKLKVMQGSSMLPSRDLNQILASLLKMLKGLRMKEYYWGLKCLNTFLESLEKPYKVITPQIQKEIFQGLNNLISSHLDMEKIPEPVLCYTFKIFLKLLPMEKSRFDADTRREITRLGKFLMTQNSMAFVYIKTEALLFRLLYQISLEQDVCVYLSDNKVVPNCFDFFKTLQIYLGFALTIRQTSEILPLVWKSILNFLKASPTANQDFIKHCGLSWMYTHLNWYSTEERIQQDLYDVFLDILNQLDQHLELTSKKTCGDSKQQVLYSCSQELMVKLRSVISESCTRPA